MLVGKICLTGGPCAGKTTALSAIEQNLQEQGYNVLIVSESATELIKGGIKPFGKNCVDILLFQDLIMNYQLNKEMIYENAANSLDGKTVIIYDRGVMDNKAYMTNRQFKQILNRNKLNELSLMDNYDMVIHLVTAADGKEEFYTLENNEARSETVEQAKELDKKTLNAWVGHRNLKIIDNSTDFETKIRRVTNEINNLLGNPISIKKERKYLIDLNKSNLDILKNYNYTTINIEQTYLNYNKGNCEKRLRKRMLNNDITYYLTVQRKNESVNKIVVDKKISEKEYLRLNNYYDDNAAISKKRFSFIYDKQYFRLDVFQDDNLAILEIEPAGDKKEIIIPNELCVIKEITNDKEYNNYSLAVSKQNTKHTKKYKVA